MNRQDGVQSTSLRASRRLIASAFGVVTLALCAYAGGRAHSTATPQAGGAPTLSTIRATATTGKAASRGPSANIGQTITLVGSGFKSNVSVQFTAFANSTFSIVPIKVKKKRVTIAVPGEVITGDVRLIDPEFGPSGPLRLEIVPSIAALTPDAVAPGSRLLIDGSGFSADSKVTFKGVAQPVVPTVVSPTRIDLVVPATAQNGKIFVVTGGGTSKAMKLSVVGAAAVAEPVRRRPATRRARRR